MSLGTVRMPAAAGVVRRSHADSARALANLMVRGICRFDIEGMATLSGRDSGADDPPPAAATAAVLRMLVDAGAVGVAKSATPPMNLGCALHH